MIRMTKGNLRVPLPGLLKPSSKNVYKVDENPYLSTERVDNTSSHVLLYIEVHVLVVYSDDMLLIASSKEALEMARDTTMFLFHHLGLVINLKKSILEKSDRFRTM